MINRLKLFNVYVEKIEHVKKIRHLDVYGIYVLFSHSPIEEMSHVHLLSAYLPFSGCIVFLFCFLHFLMFLVHFLHILYSYLVYKYCLCNNLNSK